MIALMIAQCFYGIGLYSLIFIVKYSVLFSLFNFVLGFGLLNLASASTSASRFWPRPRPRPQVFGLGLGLGLKHLAWFNISDALWFFAALSFVNYLEGSVFAE